MTRVLVNVGIIQIVSYIWVKIGATCGKVVALQTKRGRESESCQVAQFLLSFRRNNIVHEDYD